MESKDATPIPSSERRDAQEPAPVLPVLPTGTEPWVRMDPELTRAVLSKTEEELLGGLAALMRNKVELERTTGYLAQLLDKTSEAHRALERVRRQVREAEDELAARREEQVRFLGEQTADAPGLRSKQEEPGEAREEAGREENPLQEELDRLSAELEQLRATYFAFQVESNRSRESLEEEIGMLRQEVGRRRTQVETARSTQPGEGGTPPEDEGRNTDQTLSTGAVPSAEATVEIRQGHDALKRKLFRS